MIKKNYISREKKCDCESFQNHDITVTMVIEEYDLKF